MITPLLLDRKRVRRSEVETLSKSLGIREQLDKYPTQLSGGQQQRAAIVRALVHHPKVIFADKPTGNPDKETGQQVMGCLIDAVKKEGAALMRVTHNENLAAYADRVIRMENGKEGPLYEKNRIGVSRDRVGWDSMRSFDSTNRK
ncbi:MAG: ATP-binding cassette domain-containing protein [Clostridium sp.]|nr:ATP-binding cassette domain-containing protein [Clostridium sp.]